MKKFLLISTILGTTLLPCMANAQETSGAEAEETSGLGEIVVTAQRREENLQKAALPISAVSGDDLAAAGVTRATELTSLVPALQIAPAAGPYNLFYLRGVGNFNANAFSDSAIAFSMDGVYIGRPSSTTGFFYDIERLEVVKGPQGTLYGRNATGGAINVIGHRPVLGKFEASGGIEYGNYDALRLDGMVNVPLGDQAAFRVAGIRVKHDGYLSDGTDDQNDWGLRASFRAEPADNFDISISADYFDQRGKGTGSTPFTATLVGALSPTSFTAEQQIGFLSTQGQTYYSSSPNTLMGRTFYTVPASVVPFQRNSYWGVSSTINWETSAGTLTVVPAYRESRLDYLSFRPGFYVRQIEYSDQRSLETRFATPEDKLT